MNTKLVVTLNGDYGNTGTITLAYVIAAGDAARKSLGEGTAMSMFTGCTVEPYYPRHNSVGQWDKFFTAIGSRDPNELIAEISTLNSMLTEAHRAVTEKDVLPLQQQIEQLRASRDVYIKMNGAQATQLGDMQVKLNAANEAIIRARKVLTP